MNPTEILLVEDNEADVELTLHALKQGKIANPLHVVRDGEEALDFLFCRGKYQKRNGQRQPRLVLLDLKLPKVDGLEVLEKIRQSEELRTIPVVVLTASKQEQDLLRSYSLGVNSYIQKPVDFDQFRQVVREIGYYWIVVNEPPPLASAAAYLRPDNPH